MWELSSSSTVFDSTTSTSHTPDVPTTTVPSERLEATPSVNESFVFRHIGPNPHEISQMLNLLAMDTLDELIDQVVPSSIRSERPLHLDGEVKTGMGEYEALKRLKAIAAQNQLHRSYLGMGYANCITPPVIQRSILENPGWYTAYTPYQPEIAQGRLEGLLNFQTMVTDLTGLEIANASLLDEATAAAEAMSMSFALRKSSTADIFWVSQDCHPQTVAVVETRAKPLGIRVVVADHRHFKGSQSIFGVLLQYPASDGAIYDYREVINQAHDCLALVTMAADLLALTLLIPPGELGADIGIGSSQRFGIPLGYGGPHAAYFATRDQFKRQVPGRIVGVSKDVHGKPALRLALQTREQHIRRDKATSNICTAQVLLAVMAGMYGVYHGPSGLRAIAVRIHNLVATLAQALQRLGYTLCHSYFFDTLAVNVTHLDEIIVAAQQRHINLRILGSHTIGISLDETTTPADLIDLWQIFGGSGSIPVSSLWEPTMIRFLNPDLERTTPYLTHPVFNRYHSETELLRYLHRLQAKDLSLTTSMIPLGSCTMKLNAAAEMLPVTWAEFGQIHPFAPRSQTQGYEILFRQLEAWLAEITGFTAVSLQPNAGSQGEYAGLLVIREYHHHQGQGNRRICLIPQSAHGTNPASAVMAGMTVVPITCDEQGNIDCEDLRRKAAHHHHDLAALMITYPSTHGVFEASIREICQIVHDCGGQVYMDGANLNAQVGLCRPGEFGADVCHLNLHKTFCIPHGGGGPGMGPIAVMDHLAPYLPGHLPSVGGGSPTLGAISAAPWGSASILPISWMYIAMMGGSGLTMASKVAILNANYLARRLEPYFPILYKGESGWVAHECILDLRGFKKSAGIEVEDIAKRLMDYGFHAPTVSWPVAGTMMVEPTESESQLELDRFCEAMISIRAEIDGLVNGQGHLLMDNPLKNAPHTAESLLVDEWIHPYSRSVAAYPLPWLQEHKFWPTVSRIDAAYGDRHLVCSCLPMDAYGN